MPAHNHALVGAHFDAARRDADTDHWRSRASCRDDAVMSWTGAQAEDFFIVGTDWSQPVHEPGISRAKLVCAVCPVRAACLTFALHARDEHAVLGGLTPVERAPLQRAHRHTRPARQPVESGKQGN